MSKSSLIGVYQYIYIFAEIQCMVQYIIFTLRESVLIDMEAFFLVDEEDPQRLLRPVELSAVGLGVCPPDAIRKRHKENQNYSETLLLLHLQTSDTF